MFPEDILFEIFLRLPAKSVGKFRCLSKTWHTNLSTKHFTNSHLNRQQEKPIFVDRNSGSLYMPTLPLNDELPREIELRNKLDWLIGSCNGLILLREKRTNSLFVTNPITRQQVLIPQPHSTIMIHMYGFGYDPSCDDYKVVMGYYHEYMLHELFVEVYSLRKRVWKRVGRFPHTSHLVYGWVMPYVNGVLHWLTQINDSDMKYRIDAFELANETFHQVPLPTELWMERTDKDLGVLRGSLALVTDVDDTDGHYATDMWVMKEYGAVESWIRYRFDVKVFGFLARPICFVGEKELLCVGYYKRNCWVVCELKEGTAKKVVDGRYDNGNFSWSAFVESLVSLEQGTDSRNIETF